MTEEEARLELLKTELNAVQSCIQSFETIVFQIKGWCVTAALAIGGFAISSKSSRGLVPWKLPARRCPNSGAQQAFPLWSGFVRRSPS
jgi:hypothetical protein